MTQPEVEVRRAWRHVVGPDHDAFVDALLLRYAEPHRYYHTATHVMTVIRTLHDVAAMAARQPTPELVAAALYHDAIYDPRAEHNEAKSATLAVNDLSEVGWLPERCATVRVLIIATADPAVGVVGAPAVGQLAAETEILLDADRAILGSDPNRYQAYVNGVRAEYFFVDDAGWRGGRGRILQEFLDSPRIFATDYMNHEFERRARANIRAELAALR